MSGYIITGAQWGDEGKGKIVDALCEKADAVVRFQGGNNAGHTIVVGSRKYILHTIPSGVIHKGKICYIGNGVVLDPEELLKEIKELCASGVEVNGTNLRISKRTCLILDYHRMLDKARERYKDCGKIGTTGRGIGPAYEDKMSRISVRVGDILDLNILTEKITASAIEKNALFRNIYNETEINIEATAQKYFNIGKELAQFVVTDEMALRETLRNKSILYEGAQGSLLDIDFGTYPFVTSSNTLSSYFAVGSGLNFGDIKKNIAVVKAYTTRVGEGPFPTHDQTEAGDILTDKGHEFGATTGRRRKCGWLDMVALRFVFDINRYNSIALTKLDILTGFEKIKVATAYKIDGKIVHNFPSESSLLAKAEPVYEEFPGWNDDLSKVRDYAKLPENVKKYIDYIEKNLGAPVDMVSVGPGRDEIIMRNDPA